MAASSDIADPLPSQVAGLPDANQIPTYTTLANPEVVQFYRDDACFDDGTGDGPVPRPYPGNASTDAVVENGYVAYWQGKGAPVLKYTDLTCAPPQPNTTGYQQASAINYNTLPFQGAIGEFGLHFFFSSDSDNAFSPLPIDEIDAEQQVYAVPTTSAANFVSATNSAPGQDYGLNVVTPLQTVVAPFDQQPAAGEVPEVPLAALLPLVAGVVAVPVIRRRWVRRAG